ncbi:hypothetical protein KCU89_g15257, partial [Aureobasidium melanogenum]
MNNTWVIKGEFRSQMYNNISAREWYAQTPFLFGNDIKPRHAKEEAAQKLDLLDINHGIVSINTSHGHLRSQNTSASALQQFSSDLRTNGLVALDEQ